MRRRIGKALTTASVLLTVLAIVRELPLPRRRRRWHGQVLGVPYDFRVPTLQRVKRNWWSPRDRRVLVPRAFGLGWDVNVGRLWRLLKSR